MTVSEAQSLYSMDLDGSGGTGACGAGHQSDDQQDLEPMVVNTSTASVSSKQVYSVAAAALGWSEQVVPVDGDEAWRPVPTIFCGMNTALLRSSLPSSWHGSWATQFVGMPSLCDKGNFARMVSVCQALSSPQAWSFNPRTWLLPEQHGLVVRSLQKGKHTYIFKPRNGAQGDGIFLAQSLPEFTKKAHGGKEPLICQQYVTRPLLLDGFKFDLRMYVCLLGGSATSPPKVLLCREGLARFCTKRYEEPSANNMQESLAHLTNYSLNKTSEHFKEGAEDEEQLFDLQNSSSKRPLSVALRQIAEAHPNFEPTVFYEQVAQVVQTTFSAIAPLSYAYHRRCGYYDDINAMQIIGIDVILDENFKPALLELNNSPSHRISDPHPVALDSIGPLAKVSVQHAGTLSVNTTYTEGCCRQPHYVRSFYATATTTSERSCGLHCALSHGACPAGWYITEELENGTYFNVYYHRSTESSVVPRTGWMVYKGLYSKPGFRPLPEISTSSEGCDRSRHDGCCLCHDFHEMEVPHQHKLSLVDQVVKTTVIKGAFQLVHQVQSGVNQPCTEAYLPVDLAGTDLYPLLSSVGEFFFDHGLHEDWRTSKMKQKLRDVFSWFIEEGKLTAQELDKFCEQSRFEYVAYVSSPDAGPLRLLDFVELLGRVAVRTFPADEPRHAFTRVLAAMQHRVCVTPGEQEERCMVRVTPQGKDSNMAEEEEQEEDMDFELLPLFS